VQQHRVHAKRGKLRIYFGSSAGVGKTFAMLMAAQKLKREGRDVLAGVVETHGRAETAALLDGLEVLETSLAQFDIDAALARRPQLVLVDDLARSNLQGARHPKRWQDVEELLAAGIDVFTTLNVQHLESLNDVVGSVTNVRIYDTVPDTIFAHADEVVLVDVPADELLARLKAGRVHVQSPGEHVATDFFGKGNLMALRELALRRTADRVEGDVQAYRVERAIGSVWKTATALLTCVGPDPGAERVVRAAARLASQLNADWHAVYVETPRLQRLVASRREHILRILNLAKQLGATTAVIPNPHVAETLVSYARNHNLSKLVIGRDPLRRLWPWQRSHGQKLALLAPDIDLVEISRDPRAPEESAPEYGRNDLPVLPEPELSDRRQSVGFGYLWATLACGVVTVACLPLAMRFDRSNIVAIFILAVVLVAVRFGRGPSALAAVLSVGAFDFFFVPPRFSLAVIDVQYFLTFLIMLAVGLITGQLTAGLRFQARVASHREERAGSLYGISRDLSAAMEVEDVANISSRCIERIFRASAVLMLPNKDGKLLLAAARTNSGLDVEIEVAQWAFQTGQPAGFSTDTLPGSNILYIPLRAPSQARGVLAVKAHNRRLLRIPEQRQLLDTFAAVIAIALERVHYVGVAQEALLRMESERLRNSLLAAISHDLRTPLTVLQGLAEVLAMNHPPLAAAQLEAAETMQEEARRMSALVNNLLDMARIERGEVKLHLEWQPFEEVVGVALNATEHILKTHRVGLRLSHELPLVQIDAALIARVLVNLLENASKYTPAASEVTLSAAIVGDQLSVSVSDEGPGIPVGRESEIFEKFTRGHRESSTRGVGLGLSICRAIVESHHGHIIGGNKPSGGAIFTFTLPLGTPPTDAGEGEMEVQSNMALGS
jgi:two-component system, OmpR family, sensor histidine kinase KdpD